MQVTLDQILGAVAELDTASRSLAAWELCLPEAHVMTPWQQALDRGFLAFVDDQAGERFYRLSEAVPRDLRW